MAHKETDIYFSPSGHVEGPNDTETIEFLGHEAGEYLRGKQAEMARARDEQTRAAGLLAKASQE